ncbi:hypothetical protein ADUPG1_007358, partial [Aduncisulcus paluster]
MSFIISVLEPLSIPALKLVIKLICVCARLFPDSSELAIIYLSLLSRVEHYHVSIDSPYKEILAELIGNILMDTPNNTFSIQSSLLIRHEHEIVVIMDKMKHFFTQAGGIDNTTLIRDIILRSDNSDRKERLQIVNNFENVFGDEGRGGLINGHAGGTGGSLDQFKNLQFLRRNLMSHIPETKTRDGGLHSLAQAIDGISVTERQQLVGRNKKSSSSKDRKRRRRKNRHRQHKHHGKKANHPRHHHKRTVKGQHIVSSASSIKSPVPPKTFKKNGSGLLPIALSTSKKKRNDQRLSPSKGSTGFDEDIVPDGNAAGGSEYDDSDMYGSEDHEYSYSSSSEDEYSFSSSSTSSSFNFNFDDADDDDNDMDLLIHDINNPTELLPSISVEMIKMLTHNAQAKYSSMIAHYIRF